MLRFTLRIRDLIHGTIFFTDEEKRVIDHPLFQRLRHVRQNDTAFLVYPSMNTSRFEHVLGVCHVAGAMAEHMTQDYLWTRFAKSLREESGLPARHVRRDFVRIVRLYALLHDIGHFPLSHLFEMALDRYAEGRGEKGYQIAHRWGGYQTRHAAHEAYGASMAEIVLADIGVEDIIRTNLLRLLCEELIAPEDPLGVAKKLMNSEMDADRIDAYKRDGMLAGGEYGSYDVRRLTLSPFLAQVGTGWDVAYSEKALSSLEALLLDRNRTYQWIHFHHRVITKKVLAIMLLEYALMNGHIGAQHFPLADSMELALRDDVWIWNVLRTLPVPAHSSLALAKEALIFRKREHVLSLWKRRTDFHRIERSALNLGRLANPQKTHSLELEALAKSELGIDARYFSVGARKPEGAKIPLYSELSGVPTGENLLQASRLVQDLNGIWGDEPTYYMVLIGEDVGLHRAKYVSEWIKAYAEWKSL